MAIDFNASPTHYGRCPACSGEMSGSADRSEGVTYEEEVFCHAGCYHYDCVTGNSEVRVGSKSWHWSWSQESPFDEIHDHAAMLAPAMREILGVLGDAESNIADALRYYRVAADRAEDAGDDDLAAGFRWLADYGKCPTILTENPTPQGTFGWYAVPVDRRSDIDFDIYWEAHANRLPRLRWSRIPEVSRKRLIEELGSPYRSFKIRVGFSTAVLAAARVAVPGGSD